MPPAAQAIDSDESWCSDDSAPFPLPVEQLNKYPEEQRKQQQEANRFYNFFERYALEVTEAGGGLCSTNTVMDCDGMRNISVMDDSSVCGEEGTDGAADGTTPTLKKKVRWDPNLMGSCNAVDYGDFYDRYMLVVSEVGASCNSNTTGEEGKPETAQEEGALDKKASPTSAAETDQVDVDHNKNKEQVESKEDSKEQGWNLNQVNCSDIDMQPCVGMAKAIPFNLNKFWESLTKDNSDDDDEDRDTSNRKKNSKRTAARKSSLSTLSKEVRYNYVRYCTSRWILSFIIFCFDTHTKGVQESVHVYSLIRSLT
jgi:hypothetical protein